MYKITALLLLLSSPLVFADGSDLFTPTKLQWAAMELNSENGVHGSEVIDGYPSFEYAASGTKKNTVVVTIFTYRKTRKKDYEACLALAKMNIEKIRNKYEWYWLQYEINEVKIP